MDNNLLSEIGSWASIIGLIITLFIANKVYNISIKVDNTKKNKQKNSNFSLVQRDIKQENNGEQWKCLISIFLCFKEIINNQIQL